MSLLDPTSIAVIGASTDPAKVGHAVLKNLVEQGFGGAIYPINPKGGEMLGKQVFASVAETPKTPDVVVIVTPAPTVAALLRECGEKGIKNVIIISAGFGETGTEEGHAREQEIVGIAKEYGTTVLGPNCLGMLRPGISCNASFAGALPRPGDIALITQSGAFAVALLDAAIPLGLRYSAVLSIGNKTVSDECDMLELLEDDPETKVIGLYLESIKDGRRFRATASRVARAKPIVLIRAGRTAAGRKAVTSHTGALAGSDAGIGAICHGTGVRVATSLQEFTDLLRALRSPTLLTRRVAIITNAGGPGILAADAAASEGLDLPPLAETVRAALQKKLPSTASVGNPIDLVGDADIGRFVAALDACGDDPGIDGVVLLLTPQTMTPVVEVARAVIDWQKRTPLMPIVTCFMGGPGVEAGVALLAQGGIANFPTPERAVHALALLRQVAAAPAKPSRRGATARAAKARSIIRGGRPGQCAEEDAQRLLALYDIPSPLQSLSCSPEHAVELARDIGYPVVLKVSSPDIAHKTEVGGVKVDLKNDANVRAAYEAIVRSVKQVRPEATLRGVLVQKFLPVGSEFIVGGLQDPSAGPLAMVGLGGIYTELFADASFHVAPVSEEEAFVMLAELRSWKLLTGLRGKPPLDIAALAGIVARASELMAECPQIRELDLNPVLVGEQGVSIADARIIVD